MKSLAIEIILFCVLLVSCKIDQGKIDIALNKNNIGTLSETAISNVKIKNNQLIITGTNLANITDVVTQNIEIGFSKTFKIESQSSTQIIANGNSSITFLTNTAFDLILRNAKAAASFTIDFSLCNAKLNQKAIDCSIVAQDKDVLSYDASTQTWKPRAVNGLNYLGAFDASSGVAPALKPSGSYYVISVEGTISAIHFNVGDWIVSNGTGYQKIDNSSSVASVFGRSGTVIATEGDYNLDKLSDVDLQSTTPTNGKVLKFNGTSNKWVVGDDLSGGGSGSVTSSEIQDGSITGIDIANDTITLNKLNGTSDSTKYLRGDKTWANFIADVLNTPLTGYIIDTNSKPAISATDNVNVAFGKIQKFLNDINSDYVSKTDTSQTISGSWSFTNPTSFLYTQTPSGVTPTEVANVSYVKSYVDSVWTMGTGAQAGNLFRTSGNVGIGTNTPARLLHVEGPIRVTSSSLPASPATGDIAIDNGDSNKLKWYNGSSWQNAGNTGIASSVLASAGSSTSPSISFSSDDDTGFFSSVTNTIGITAGGNSIFSLNSNGLTSTTTSGALISNASPTASAPTYTFVGDTNTGWFRPAASSIALTTNGSERLRIDSSGNLGIGTTTPTSKLSVVGVSEGSDVISANSATGNIILRPNGTSGNVIRFGGTGANSGVMQILGPSDSSTVEFSTGTQTFRSFGDARFDYGITTGGNVGIGTSSPVSRLDLDGGVTVRGISSASAPTATAGQGKIYFDSTDNKFKVSENNGSYVDLVNTASTVWSTGSGTVYADNKKIGIDTNSPDAQIALGNKGYGQSSPKTYSNFDKANFWFYESQNFPTANAYGRILDIVAGGSSQGGHIRFLTQPASGSALTRMIINSSGNIGIGTTTPTTKLTVTDGTTTATTSTTGATPLFSVQAQGPALIMGRDNANSIEFLFGTSVGGYAFSGSASNHGYSLRTGNSDRLFINSTGSVGIGNTSPSYKLDVTGDVNTSGCVRAGGSVLGGTCTSDEVLKSEIQSFNLGLDALLGFNPKMFRYNGLGEQPKSKNLELGVIAQDIEKTAPNLIVKKQVRLYKNDQNTTEIKQVNYSAFIYVVINAVKELYYKIINLEHRIDQHDRELASKAELQDLEELKIENEKLKNKNIELEKRLEKIEKALDLK